MNRVYLDTQQWRYLVEPPEQSSLGVDAADLERAVQHGRIRIVSSVDLIQELACTFGSDDSLAKAMLTLAVRLSGRRILQPLDRRHLLEMQCGGMLSERRRYLPGRERSQLIELLDDPRGLAGVKAEVNREKAAFKMDEERRRRSAREDIRAVGGEVTPASLRAWFESVDRQAWVQDAVESGVERGLYPPPDAQGWDLVRLPSTFTFVAFRQARIVQTLGDGRKIVESDLADGHHAACAAYCDVIVTDDKRFREALQMLKFLRCEVLTSSEFRVHLAN